MDLITTCNVRNSILPNSPKLESSQLSMSRGREEEGLQPQWNITKPQGRDHRVTQAVQRARTCKTSCLLEEITPKGHMPKASMYMEGRSTDTGCPGDCWG